MTINNLANKILLLSNPPGHPQNMSDWCENTNVVFLSPNSPLLQPCNQGIIALFKAFYTVRKLWDLIMISGQERMSVQDYQWNFNIKKSLDNIVMVVEEVSPSNRNAAGECCGQKLFTTSQALLCLGEVI